MAEIVDRNGKPTLIPNAAMLADALTSLPPGETSDLATVRRMLAETHQAAMCCPVTVQRLLVDFSKEGAVPYWRVVDPDRPFAKRLNGGGDRVRELLAAEQK